MLSTLTRLNPAIRRLSTSPTIKMPDSVPRELLLKSGYKIPTLALGVYQTPAADCEKLVRHAIETGYRHIDSATAYRNELPCVRGITTSPLPRSSIFFTTKLPPKLHGYDATKASINNILETIPELEGYIDLYLIHCPYGTRADRIGQWRAMVEAQRAGQIRSLGVSNYGVHHLNELKEWMDSVPPEEAGVLSVNQVEVHPWCARRDIRDWCRNEGVVVEAYAPLVRGERMEEKVLEELSEKYGKTKAQVLIKWSLQEGMVALPKSGRTERIEENWGVWGWELEESDVKKLETGIYAPVCWDPTVEPIKGEDGRV